jgi:hypothetical protein
MRTISGFLEQHRTETNMLELFPHFKRSRGGEREDMCTFGQLFDVFQKKDDVSHIKAQSSIFKYFCAEGS